MIAAITENPTSFKVVPWTSFFFLFFFSVSGFSLS